MTARIACPECETVLKPAKPLAPGKAVKCPKCGNVFKAPSADAVKSSKPKAKAAASPAGKKSAAKKDEKKQDKPKAAVQDDDDENQTYGVIKESEEEEETKPKISYAPDTSIKDLRGPAQAKVIKPTNIMTLWGAINFIGWVLLLLLILIPAVFPIDTDQGTKENTVEALEFGAGLGRPPATGMGGLMGMTAPPSSSSDDKDGKADKEDRPMMLCFGVNLALFGLYSIVMFLAVIVIPILAGMAYVGLLCMGAVKAQNLESRGWGITSCILCMIPLGGLGLMILLSTIVNFAGGMMFDDQDTIDYICYGIIVLVILVGLTVGILNLKTLLHKDVIAGFEYKPD